MVPDTDSGSLFHFSHHCAIGYFRSFISISHSHRLIFTQRGKMTHAKRMNPVYYGNDPADIRIRIRIDPESRI